MKVREINLIKLLKLTTDKVNCEVILKPQLADYKDSCFYNQLYSIYTKFGGIQNEVPFNIGSYDCIVNGTIVELDEENHFNRYRAITLEADIYNDDSTLKKGKYLNYCKVYESKCGKGGGFWSNDSSDRWFGKSNSPGNLVNPGSSRWKQRAFYDLLKDHIPYILGIPVKRISIYETIAVGRTQHSVNDILMGLHTQYAQPIYKKLFS
jgi:hypothetical protein